MLCLKAPKVSWVELLPSTERTGHSTKRDEKN